MSKITVLVVDDDSMNREILAAQMEDFGYEYLLAKDGEEAMTMLRANPGISLVLLDRMMPKMDGLEFMSILRKDPKLADMPVIMQSAAAAAQSVQEGFRAGVDDYLTKPYDDEELKTTIDKVLNAAKAS